MIGLGPNVESNLYSVNNGIHIYSVLSACGNTATAENHYLPYPNESKYTASLYLTGMHLLIVLYLTKIKLTKIKLKKKKTCS